MRCRKHRPLLQSCCLAGIAALLLAGPSHSATMVPTQIEYRALVNEDPAAKVCQLAVVLRKSAAGEGLNFQLMVAQMKRSGELAGPLVTGFTAGSRNAEFGVRKSPRPGKLASVAFVSERYSSVALPKVVPFEDGSVAASTLDFAQGRELITAVLRADFELRLTMENSLTADSYKVSSPPPADVLADFSLCLGSLASF
jgi:hypothetical protein